MVHLVAKVLEKQAPDVRALRSDVPRALAAVIQCCLAKEPNRRYRSYADLRSALLPQKAARCRCVLPRFRSTDRR
jgi:serine/threonine protein kinase